MYAAISSLSLSLLATGIDSVFDIGSNIMLYWLHRKAGSLDMNKWPVGGSRLETIGNIVYGTSCRLRLYLMFFTDQQLLLFPTRRIPVRDATLLERLKILSVPAA